MGDWDRDKAREYYNLAHWSAGYFDINSEGRVVARPGSAAVGTEVDLYALTDELRDQGLAPPVLIRFVDILDNRVDLLVSAFSRAMGTVGYNGGYTSVYPIKVNQQRSVVEQILAHGKERVGLEAGSKPEMLAVLALAPHENCLVVCNGYKDREYIRLALIGILLGYRVHIVVEKISELDLIIDEAKKLNVMPSVGVRVRLASLGKGNWQNTGGEKSKFGLSAAQILAVVDRLRQAHMLDALQMMHVHLGSQIANVHDIQRGMQEAARYYAELSRLNAKIRMVDVGGGLGIDYEGTRSRSFCSMNYTVEEYAANIVHSFWEVCKEQGLPHPHLVTEAGRALTAHHAVLVTNVVDVEEVPGAEAPPRPRGKQPQVIENLWAGFDGLDSRSVIETYHDAVHWLEVAQDLYTHGMLSLEQRAAAEQIYHAICHRVHPLLNPTLQAHREVLDELNQKRAHKYFCNFSVFQSVPDVWAIKQIFPVVPLDRLNERPERPAVVADITCDSDGRIDRYVHGGGVENSVLLHPFDPGRPYYLGMFLVGAYQEILGDMHNLFGDTNAVDVVVGADGTHRLTRTTHGDNVEKVLNYVNYSGSELISAFRNKTAAADLSDEQRALCLEALESGLQGYTYLED